MLTYKTAIEESDGTPDCMEYITVCAGKSVTNKFGTFRHSEMINSQYGSKIFSVDKKKYLYLLHPTPELWTRVLPHRTQILYLADIAFISCKLEILPGKTVVESGTGSGSFSHSIARSIGENGHLYTFEFHAERAEKARQEFVQHKLTNTTICCQDVCQFGFGLDGKADSVFLDLPAPWKAIAFAKQAMKKSVLSKICCFSPCIEQIQRTITALIENGFCEIELFEVLIRNHECQSIKLKEFGLKEDLESETCKKIKLDTPDRIMSSRIIREVRGHTSYLLFASLLPQ